MPYSVLDEEWACVRSLLPENLDELARQNGAMRRARGQIRDAETLLRVLLLHGAGGLSLAQTVVRAREQALAELSAVALFKRLRTSEQFLGVLTREVLASLPGPSLLSLGGSYRLRALDATCVQEPGSTRTSWRLHYSLRLPELICDFVELTDGRGAEHLRRLPVQKGDVILADRGYSHRTGAAALLRAGADLVLRLVPSNFPLLNADGEPLDLPALLASASPVADQILEWPVQFVHDGETFALRLCVVRKAAAAIAAAQRQARYERERKGGTVQPATLELAAYVCVLTSLPAEVLTARQALDLYRCRWQIELAFKRLKSLLHMDQLLKKEETSGRSWLQLKILVALLTDKLILESELFSPWGYRLGK